MQPGIQAYHSEALAGFSTAEALRLYRLLDRLRGSLSRLSPPERD